MRAETHTIVTWDARVGKIAGQTFSALVLNLWFIIHTPKDVTFVLQMFWLLPLACLKHILALPCVL